MDVDFRTYLSERLFELEREAEVLRGRLKRCEAEIEDIRKASDATGITLLSKEEMTAPTKFSEITRKIDRTAEYTMKDAAVKILQNLPDGLTANEIREMMRDEYGLEYARSSLSPQLSRLKADNIVGKRHERWILAKYLSPNADLDNAEDKLTGEEIIGNTDDGIARAGEIPME